LILVMEILQSFGFFLFLFSLQKKIPGLVTRQHACSQRARGERARHGGRIGPWEFYSAPWTFGRHFAAQGRTILLVDVMLMCLLLLNIDIIANSNSASARARPFYLSHFVKEFVHATYNVTIHSNSDLKRPEMADYRERGQRLFSHD
jgi:hypothetical protein